MGDLRSRLADPLAWWLSKRELRRLIAGAGEDPGALIRVTEAYQGRGYYSRIPTVQEDEELVGLAKKVRALQPRVIVEIGTFKGGTLFVFSRLSIAIRKMVSIDLPGGEYGGGYHPRRRRLYREFLFDRPGACVDLFQADSHSSETLERLGQNLVGDSIDFLYIDGDHTYEGVRSDFEMYSPLVRKGGLVGFHDIVTMGRNCGVSQLWSELREQYKTEQWVAENSTKGNGLLYV